MLVIDVEGVLGQVPVPVKFRFGGTCRVNVYAGLQGVVPKFRPAKERKGGIWGKLEKSSIFSENIEVPKFAEDHSGRLTFASRNVQVFLYILLFIIYYIITYVSCEHLNLLVSATLMCGYYSLCQL